MSGRPFPPKIDHPYVFSVSQIETFLLCDRLWAFDKIDGVKRPDTPATLLGGEVHTSAENYLRSGIPIDTDTKAGKILMAGFRYLPAPKTPGMKIEEWFALQFGVAAYRGLKDVEIIQPGKVPQVKDHKTTSNLSWMKTPKDLEKDIQAGLYAADTMDKTGSKLVEVEWIYYQTKGARASANSKTILDRSLVSPILDRIDETSGRMIKVLQTVGSAAEATPNYKSCSAFGGCPHRGVRCVPAAKGTLGSMFKQKGLEGKMKRDTAGFLASLKNRDKKEDKSAPSKTAEAKKSPLPPKKGITSPERKSEDVPIPAAPDPVRINGKIYSATFNEDLWEWVWPEEVTAAKKKKTSAPVFTNKKKSKEEEETPEEAEEEEEEEEEVPVPAKKPAVLLGKKNPTPAPAEEEEEPDAGVAEAAKKYNELLDSLAEEVVVRALKLFKNASKK